MRTLPVALLLLAAFAAAARAEEASEEVLRAAEEAADRAERVRVEREREELGKSDEDVAAIQRVLDTTKIDLDFTDASLEDIIGFIREYAKINIEIDQKVREQGWAEKKITFQMREAVLRNVLNLLLRQYGLGYVFDHRVLLITKPRKPHESTLRDFDVARTWRDFHVPPPEGVESAEADEKVRQSMKDIKISLGFTDCPLDDVLGFLTEYTRIQFCIDAGSVQKAGGKITFRVDELPFEQAFDLIMKMLDLNCYVQGGVVHIVSGEALCVLTRADSRWQGGLPRELSPLGKNDQGYEEFRHEGTGIVFVRIPAGEYKRAGKDGAVGGVTVAEPLLIGKTEVTNGQFRAFADRRHYLRGHSSGAVHGQDLDGGDQPVVGVSWYEVHGFCEWAGVRLPTEDQWGLVACDAHGWRFPWGNEWPPPAEAGNYADVADDGSDGLEAALGRRRDGYVATAPVGRGRPNPFGIHDLGGNVWEWCAGPVDPPPFKGPPHPLDFIFERSGAVLRGGGWCDARPSLLNCNARLEYPAALANPAVGFRVAMDDPR